MATAQRRKVKTPQTRSEMGSLLFRLGNLVRERGEIHLQYDQQRAEIDELENQAVTPMQEEIEAISKALLAYYHAHEDEIEGPEGKQSLVVPTGAIARRLNPRSTLIEDEEATIEELRRMGLVDFLHTQVLVDRAALIKAWEDLSETPTTVKIVRTQRYVAKPTGVGDEILLLKETIEE